MIFEKVKFGKIRGSGKLCKHEKSIHHLFWVIKDKERKKNSLLHKKITSAVTIKKI